MLSSFASNGLSFSPTSEPLLALWFTRLTPHLNSSHAPAGIWPNLQPPLLREPWHGHTCRALSSPRQTSVVPFRPLGPPATRPKRTMVRSTAATHGTARRAGTARAHAVQTF